jgi:flagellar assembly protein FliH
MSDKPLATSRHGGAWKRWEMEAFETPGSRRPTAPPPPDPARQQADLQRLRDAAEQAGRTEGYAAGYAEGRPTGEQEGHETGHAQGYEAGLAMGHAAGQELARQEAARLQELAQASAASLLEMEEEMGQALIALAIQIAERVLRSTLDSQPEKMLDVVRDIIHLEADKEAALTLRVHPADEELIRQYLASEPAAGHWRLRADETIARGGCIAETVLGSIDATLQTRWERVTAALGAKPRRRSRKADAAAG